MSSKTLWMLRIIAVLFVYAIVTGLLVWFGVWHHYVTLDWLLKLMTFGVFLTPPGWVGLLIMQSPLFFFKSGKYKNRVVYVWWIIYGAVMCPIAASMISTVAIPIWVRSEYAAEAIPSIGNLHTMTVLYRHDRGHLPGMLYGAKDIPIESAPLGMSPVGGTSHLGTGFLTQTFRPVVDDQNMTRYEPAVMHIATNLGVHPGYADITADQVAYCFSRNFDIAGIELMGWGVRPQYIMYWCPVAGLHTGSYTYAFGAFGDGEGLPSGTGYAVLEIANPSVDQKRIATWKRWLPVVKRPSQIVFVSPDENPAADPASARTENYCWVPSKATITTDDPAVFNAMLDDLRKAGWRF